MTTISNNFNRDTDSNSNNSSINNSSNNNLFSTHSDINTASVEPKEAVESKVKAERLVLDREEVYDPNKERIWCFKHVDDIVEGTLLNLGNMTSCYPFEFEGVRWRSSEELYLSGEFSDDTQEHLAVQQELRQAKSPYAAKRFIKAKHRNKVRKDFEEFRTQWMLFVVWVKCLGSTEFRQKLLSIPDDITLIEETTTDTGGSASVWGCSNPQLVKARKELETRLKQEHSDLKKAQLKELINIQTNAIRNIGLFKGQNNIGKILMLCRECLKKCTAPKIDIDLLRSKQIHILGKRLDFDMKLCLRYHLIS